MLKFLKCSKIPKIFGKIEKLFLIIEKNILFFGSEIFFGHSFDVKIRDLSIGDVFRAIPALLRGF